LFRRRRPDEKFRAATKPESWATKTLGKTTKLSWSSELSRKGRMEAAMTTKITVGIYALVSRIYAVADEIAVHYMRAAANGAAAAADASQ